MNEVVELEGGRDEVLTARLPRLPQEEIERLLRSHYGITGKVGPLSGERDQNFRVETPGGDVFVFKVANAAEKPETLDFHNAALDHIARKDTTLPVPRPIAALSGERIISISSQGSAFRARLLTHVPGEPALLSRPTPLFRRRLGALAARLDLALADFRHPAADDRLIWDLCHAADLRDRLSFIADPRHRALAERVIGRFDERAVPAFGNLRRQVIHNDLNQNNVLRGAETAAISGIIDFGDMVRSCLVNEVAIAVAHQLYRQPDVMGAAAELVEGYARLLPLEAAEIDVLFDLVQMRLLAREIIASWRAATSEGPTHYRPDISAMGWEALERCAAIEPDKAIARLAAAANGPATTTPGKTTDAAYDALMRRRSTYLGPLYKQFYETPFFPVKGDGVWVTDHNGRRYLDAYNNVPHVGHSHPHVSEAIARQAGTFNSNTRYPSDLIVDYAERIAATMPEPLKVCMFVCSGTEANELAWRIARANTGGDGAIVTRSAFHGNSTIIGALDTTTLPAERLEPWVATVPAPEFPGVREIRNASDRLDYAQVYRRSIEDLAARGHRPAAFYACPMFASDGLHNVPSGYLDPALAEIRAAGALIVADEVQTALGRTGDRFWGFEHAGFMPDIVTMAKPMGNGIPLAVVVTSRELVEGFLRRERYFNTFGGNQVAAAAGMAVLDVLAKERLQENALTVGDHMRERIAALMTRHEAIGDVRGAGFFVGVEIIENRQTNDPAPAKARAIIEGLMQRGVLVGITGGRRNLLKIRPPMVFSRRNADLLVETLDDTLSAVCG